MENKKRDLKINDRVRFINDNTDSSPIGIVYVVRDSGLVLLRWMNDDNADLEWFHVDELVNIPV